MLKYAYAEVAVRGEDRNNMFIARKLYINVIAVRLMDLYMQAKAHLRLHLAYPKLTFSRCLNLTCHDHTAFVEEPLFYAVETQYKPRKIVLWIEQKTSKIKLKLRSQQHLPKKV